MWRSRARSARSPITQERAVRNGAGMPAREVVEDDDVMAAVDEALDARGPDVAGAADDENLPIHASGA